jgi:hypothetical protein
MIRKSLAIVFAVATMGSIALTAAPATAAPWGWGHHRHQVCKTVWHHHHPHTFCWWAW